MKDFIYIGSSPCEESCAQVGEDDYERKSRDECRRFIRDIRLELGPEPEGARLTSRSFPHDYGSYREVICEYDNENEEAVAYALKCESNAPAYWRPEPWPEPQAEETDWDTRRKMWEQETGRPHPMSLGAVLESKGVSVDAALGGEYDEIGKLIEAAGLEDSSGLRRAIASAKGVGEVRRLLNARADESRKRE